MKRFFLTGHIALIACLFAAGGAWPATIIYRSVGPGNTSALASGSVSSLLTVSGNTATFGSALPNNVGVGDVVQYSTGGSGTIDALAVIQGRTDSSHFTVVSASGGAPPPIASTNIWAVYRAYTSLYYAERGTENTGIDSNVRNFDTWSSGKDITAATGSDEIWNIACYADGADTDRVTISGWTTAPGNYIRIFTPVSTNEVGVSQRHHGTWDVSAYRLEITNDTALSLGTEFVRLEGLQIRLVGVSQDHVYGISFEQSSTLGLEQYVSDTIVRGDPTVTTYNGQYGIYIPHGQGEARLWNNLVYDCQGVTGCAFNLEDDGWTFYVYNNTVDNCTWGFWRQSGNVAILKNNLVQNCTDGYRGTFDAASDYNLSDLAGDAPGTHSKNSTSVSFVDAPNDDFHLAASDTGARNAGTDLSSDPDLAFSNDIDGQTRSAPWDIGADEYLSVGTPTPTPTSQPPLSPTRTTTRTATPTATPTRTPTEQFTRTTSPTSTVSPTTTPTPSITTSFTVTPTYTAPPPYTPTPTPTRTGTFTASPTGTRTRTPTQSATYTATPSITATLTISATHTVTPTVSETSTPAPVERITVYPQPAQGDKLFFAYPLETPADVRIEIYNVAGEKVVVLEDHHPAAGTARTEWDIQHVAPGVYTYRVKYGYARGEKITSWKKLVIVK